MVLPPASWRRDPLAVALLHWTSDFTDRQGGSGGRRRDIADRDLRRGDRNRIDQAASNAHRLARSTQVPTV